MRIVLWLIQGYVTVNAFLRAYVLLTMPGPMAAQIAYLPGPVRYVAAALYILLGLGLVVPDLLRRRGAVEAAMVFAVISSAELIAALMAGRAMSAGARGLIVALLIAFIYLRRRGAAATAA